MRFVAAALRLPCSRIIESPASSGALDTAKVVSECAVGIVHGVAHGGATAGDFHVLGVLAHLILVPILLSDATGLRTVIVQLPGSLQRLEPINILGSLHLLRRPFDTLAQTGRIKLTALLIDNLLDYIVHDFVKKEKLFINFDYF